ncbi:hypothetical protein QD712_25970 [Streptomyces acidiscabies]|uniref:hypothetical protein n=1 Tax=Streptomyces acidiscabies TaxID=42234 RepID=UPI0030D1C0C3
MNGRAAEGAGVYGWCTWHRAYAYGLRVISLVEEGRAAYVLYACGHCRTLYGLIPQADRP